MTIVELFSGIEHKIYGDESIKINGLKYDSREVQEGDLFFCVTGFNTDGHLYAPQAINNGAVAIVVTKLQSKTDITQILVEDDREAMALVAAKFYDYPATKMKIVGITGTNGKTTTTYMIKKIAETAGEKVGLLGTITNMIGEKELDAIHTTPEAIDLHRLLKQMHDEDCTLIVMEVSSHSLGLKRVFGIVFDIGLFTNLSQDHLDFHKSWDDYVQTKSLMFQQCNISLINNDDTYANAMEVRARDKVLTFAIEEESDYMATGISLESESVSYDVLLGEDPVHIRVNIPGLFTVYNSLGAAIVAYLLGIDASVIQSGLGDLKAVPGRFELLDNRGENLTIILDYAHTPDGLENVLQAIQGFAPARIVTVFGCGGNRDAEKRPKMGRIAGELSDFVIITSDNPRFESPGSIIEQIEAGIKEMDTPYLCIEHRKNAIKYAIEYAEKDDIIVLAGKGHETYQEIKGKRYDFDEKKVVSNVFDELNISKTKESNTL